MVNRIVPRFGDKDRHAHLARLATHDDSADADADADADSIMLRNFVRLAVEVGLIRPLAVSPDRTIMLSPHLWVAPG